MFRQRQQQWLTPVPLEQETLALGAQPQMERLGLVLVQGQMAQIQVLVQMVLVLVQLVQVLVQLVQVLVQMVLVALVQLLQARVQMVLVVLVQVVLVQLAHWRLAQEQRLPR